METDVCLPASQAGRQEAFWACVQDWTRRQLTGLLEMVLKSEQEGVLAAGWNERKTGRSGWRNGYYRRGLVTSAGPRRRACSADRPCPAVPAGTLKQLYQPLGDCTAASAVYDPSQRCQGEGACTGYLATPVLLLLGPMLAAMAVSQ